MTGRVVLVTGASRGIGLGLVRELLRVGGYQVVATCRFRGFESCHSLVTLSIIWTIIVRFDKKSIGGIQDQRSFFMLMIKP